ncbi:MAG: sigma 54-interacting transcriptional regulator, partial [Oscillospiraceae bacterium]|nr:sigma 54-interacting transcriptional regulator [Oscillospiraceae bacterium]
MSNDGILRSETDFLRRVISENNDFQIIVIDSSGEALTPVPSHLTLLLPVLREHMAEIDENESCRLVRRRGGSVYRINGNTDCSMGEKRYVFYISNNVSPSSDNGSITHYDPEEIQNDVDASVFGITHTESLYESELSEIMSRSEPVLISGEIGIGKDHMAKTIYLRSRRHRDQFVVVNCTRINARNWNSLIRWEESPLYDVGNTIFIQNLDALTYDQVMQLLTAIDDSR